MNDLRIFFDVGRGSGILSKCGNVTGSTDILEFTESLQLFADDMDIGGLVIFVTIF
jgi:hypothetical protein